MPSQTPQDPYAPTQWQAGSKPFEHTCPSGQRCLLRRPDFGRMIESGLLDNFDFVTGEVQKTHVSKKSANARTRGKAKAADDQAAKMWKDPKQRAEMMQMVNLVTVESVVAPRLEMPPENWDDRKDDVIYVDTVQLFDRMDIVQTAFGSTKALANFRAQIEQFADRMDDDGEVPTEAKPDLRDT